MQCRRINASSPQRFTLRALPALLCALAFAWPAAGQAQEAGNSAAPKAPMAATVGGDMGSTGGGISQSGIAAMLERLTQEQQHWLEAAQEAPDAPSTMRVAVPAKALRKGSKGPEVAVLCSALQARGFAPCNPGQDTVDAALAARIATAQRYYGLAADGLADTQLYNALALSAQERAARIAALVNQWESIRAQARELGVDRYVVVNVPSFEVKAVAGDAVALASRAVVGRPERQTPIGTMNIRALKFNPDWTPPPTVLKRDIYPALASGGAWIREHGLVLVDRAGKSVEWEGMSVDEIRNAGYRFVQPASEHAALGLLKFETDSSENIYLHDTNERHLFTRASRARSSGCIRVERWRELAAWMSNSDTAGIERKVSTRKTFFEATPKVPVFVVYQLADLSEGRVVFYPDIYQRGEKALEQNQDKSNNKPLVAQR